MTKQEQLNEIISKYNIDEEAAKALLVVLAKNASGGKTSDTPDKTDEAGNITERYCNLHKCYEPIDNFGTGKKKECKAGVWRWNVINRGMTAITNEIMTPEIDYKKADYDLFKANYNALKDSRVPGSTGYNLDTDWADYVLATTKEVK